MQNTQKDKPKVLLLGAGYANIAFLKSLDRRAFDLADFTLISESSKHYVAISLHDVVSGLKGNEVEFEISEIAPCEVKIITDSVKEIKQNLVLCENSEAEFDYLIVGLGFNSDSFGIKGIADFTTPIVNFANSSELHNRLKNKIADYKNGILENLNIVVCGGGFSGIELIASIWQNLPKLLSDSEKNSVSAEKITLTCIEAMPNILPMFSENLANKAKNFLESRGVRVATNSKILECKKNAVVVQNGDEISEIAADLIIWTAGVRGNAVIEKSSFFTSMRSKIEIDKFLQPINQENQALMGNIFVLGDCAALRDENGRFYAPTAQIAIREGEYLGKNFVEILNEGQAKSEFNYTIQGTVCSLGSRNAVGVVGTTELSGTIASILKHIIEAKWLWKIKGFAGLSRAFL